jgi:hypothetical protein
MSPPRTEQLQKQGFHVLLELASLNLPAVGATLASKRIWLTGKREAGPEGGDRHRPGDRSREEGSPPSARRWIAA